MAVSTFHRITLAAQLFRSWRGWPPAKQVKIVESAYCIRLLFCSNRVIKRVLFCVVRGRETVFYSSVVHNFFRNFDVPIGVLLFTLPSGCSVDKESSKERNGTKTSFFQACDFASTQIEKILYLKISVPQKAFKRFQLRADNS